jgi:predicted RNase H-like nuclease
MREVWQPAPVAVVMGVDGRRGGWAVAVLTTTARRARPRIDWHSMPGQDGDGFAAVLALADRVRAVAVGVDCPIGLPSHDWRACDLAAKRVLGRASARVFLAPPREVLAAPTYAEARTLARELLDGRGVSAQTYGLRRIVLAVDDVLRSGHPGAPRVVEVHPELSFMAMTGRAPGDPLPSKKTPEGRAARLAAVGSWTSGAGVTRVAELDVPDGDDHLDALAAAWSARRWAAGVADVLGGDVDAAGLPMRIVT